MIVTPATGTVEPEINWNADIKEVEVCVDNDYMMKQRDVKLKLAIKELKLYSDQTKL